MRFRLLMFVTLLCAGTTVQAHAQDAHVAAGTVVRLVTRDDRVWCELTLWSTSRDSLFVRVSRESDQIAVARSDIAALWARRMVNEREFTKRQDARADRFATTTKLGVVALFALALYRHTETNSLAPGYAVAVLFGTVVPLMGLIGYYSLTPKYVAERIVPTEPNVATVARVAEVCAGFGW